MLLLIDIGNTHTHLGSAVGERITKHADIPTRSFERAAAALKKFCGHKEVEGVSLCSVVPAATDKALAALRNAFHKPILVLTAKTVRGIGIDYPKPATIGPDRLANALAARTHHGAPAVVIDFGTAVTFDVINQEGNYAGGVIAPGLSAMTDYLHEKTALLPRIRIRDIDRSIGKSTKEAMLIGAVHGYRGLIRELLAEIKKALGARQLAVIATGGCAELMASKLPEIQVIDPLLTLEGLRLAWWNANRGPRSPVDLPPNKL